MIASLLHATYVVDFFVNEDWYLRTIDICHDHFGFYLAWGSMVWLPSMYTLQTQYLARNPLVLPTPVAALILMTGIGGYALFRSVNHQKNLCRKTKGECLIWGKKPDVVRCEFLTADGQKHESLLLCSGTSPLIHPAPPITRRVSVRF
jgi:7-dehydrocholesterol reductase